MAKLRLAGQHFDALRLLAKVGLSSKQPYVGLTGDLRQRLKDHNEGRSPHTARFRPWLLLAYFAFVQEETAINFEEVPEVRFRASVHQTALPLVEARFFA
jgi:predicted GIY-YIG superfamily endonuclease